MTPDDSNPLGLDGFAFCEFTSPDPAAMAAQFEQLGFVAAARVPEPWAFTRPASSPASRSAESAVTLPRPALGGTASLGSD